MSHARAAEDPRGGPPPLRLAVLIGGGGSGLQALLDAERAGTVPATVSVVVCHRAGAGGISRGLDAHVPTLYVPPPVGRRRTPDAVASYERLLITLLDPFQVDLVVLAGWMLVFSPLFLAAFPGAVINIHPALLPDDGGETVRLADGRAVPALRGAHAVEDALAAVLDTTGATVHLVASEVDRGPVLCRREVPILPGDTPDSLHHRIKEAEHALMLAAIGGLARRQRP